MMEVPQNVKEMIITIRIKCRQDVDYAPTSHKSFGFLRSIFEGTKKRDAILKNKNNRIPVLIALTGFDWLSSQTLLTQQCTSVLINELIDENDHAILRHTDEIAYIEGAVEGRTISEILDQFPWERASSNMPNVQEDNPDGTGDARGLPF